MSELTFDEEGFTCECGIRNDYPAYVSEHWDVRLLYSCQCARQYLLYRGRVQRVMRGASEYQESEAFGD
jgi:hypothetical protein